MHYKWLVKNLMHANLTITDEIYGILSETDVRGQFGALGQQSSLSDEINLIQLADMLFARLVQKGSLGMT